MTTRPAAVAGGFYPATERALRDAVRGYLSEASSARKAPPPKALIAPHAGYVYSGPIAAHAYAQFADMQGTIRRVVLLGPAHRVAVRGLALPEAGAFVTPLGTVPIDADAVSLLDGLPQVARSDRAHALEHSLEVQLPFLQEVLGNFTLVPLVVGNATTNEVAEVFDALWDGPETLVVVSSDLSHYLPYELARGVDARTAQAIGRLEAIVDHHLACGATPINGLLEVARRRGLRVERLDLRNSGDTAGERDRVVGYGAWAFYEPVESTDDTRTSASRSAKGRTLIALAREAIAHRLGLGVPPRQAASFLREPGASFVTLKRDGELRGCIGSLDARRPLGEDVAHNACAAAFADPRFAPLSPADFADTRIEVSLLSPPEPIGAHSLAELRAQLRPQVDGLILSSGGQHATFLPQVWEQLPDPVDFVAHLQRKAGLPVGTWPADMRASRYTVEKFSEGED